MMLYVSAPYAHQPSNTAGGVTFKEVKLLEVLLLISELMILAGEAQETSDLQLLWTTTRFCCGCFSSAD